VTNLPLDVDNFRVSPTGERIALSMAVFRDCADLACTKAGRCQGQGQGQRPGLRPPVRAPLGYLGRRPQRRAVLGAARRQRPRQRAPVSLSGSLDGDVPSKPFGDREEYRFSPDGKTVVFSVRIAGKTEAWSTNFDLYACLPAGGAPRNLTADNQAWDTKGVFSPDGRTLAYLAMTRPGFEADRYHIVLLDVASGKKRNSPKTGTARPAPAVDARRQVADRRRRGHRPARLFAIDVASGKVTPLTGKGSIGGFDVRGDTIAFTPGQPGGRRPAVRDEAGAASNPVS
jgi:dipeptidyl aminopeptidase/acylaminoacyl peptidase